MSTLHTMHKISSANKIHLSLLILLVLLCSNPSQALGSDNREVASNSAQFDKIKVISRGKLINVMDFLVPHKYTVFMFYADWCAPCGPLKEKFHELAQKVDNVALREIDIIDLENPLVKYYNIPAIPYFLIYGPEGNFLERGPMISKTLLNSIVSEYKQSKDH